MALRCWWAWVLGSLGLGAVGLGACRAHGQAHDLVFLRSTASPQLVAEAPASAGPVFTLEGGWPEGTRAGGVVLSGHSAPPWYLDQPAEALARRLVALGPELIVFDTCFGASSPILEALSSAGFRGWVVAGAYPIPERGLAFAPPFFDPRLAWAQRAQAPHTVPPFPMVRWRVQPGALGPAYEQVARWRPAELRRRLRSVVPTLVGLPFPAPQGGDPGARLLVPVPPDRLREH